MPESQNSREAGEVACEGWWEEVGYGRQPMENLQLRIQDGRISGSGIDIVGPFSFVGTITGTGQVAMVKRYIGKHLVEYLGTYDGEGTMWGEWHIGPLRDRWVITLKRASRTSETHAEDAVLIE